MLAPVLLIVVVLGSILIGLATPTEAAAVGAVGAILLAALRIEGAARWPALLCVAGFARTDARCAPDRPARRLGFCAGR